MNWNNPAYIEAILTGTSILMLTLQQIEDGPRWKAIYEDKETVFPDKETAYKFIEALRQRRQIMVAEVSTGTPPIARSESDIKL